MAEEARSRELSPNLTTTVDLVNNIGSLSVDILNKEKVLIELWKNVDELTANVKSLSEEVQSLNNVKDTNENTLSTQGEQLQRLESEKQSIEKALREDIADITGTKDAKILKLENALNSLQEKTNKDLIEARSEIFSLKSINESINKKTPKGKKKKTNAKPARA